MAAKRREKAPVGARPRARAEPAIEELLAAKAHPLDEEIRQLRQVVLGVSPAIREEIKWGSVSFRNENDFFATVHLRSSSALQLVLHTGVKKKPTARSGVPVDDPAGIIQKWLAKDRCLVTLGAGDSFRANRRALAALVKAWIQFV